MLAQSTRSAPKLTLQVRTSSTSSFPAAHTLLSASTSVDGTQLNLSHVCVGPPTEVPEAPFALLLPLIALAAFGGYLLKNRRSTFGA